MNRRIVLAALVVAATSSPAIPRLHEATAAPESAPQVVYYIGRDEPDGIALTKGDQEGTRTFPFKLPADSHQGPDRWYLLSLHFRVAFRAPFRPLDSIHVGAATNEMAAAQITFRPITPEIMRWDGANLVQGTFNGYSTTGVVDLTYVNDLQVAGVRGGSNQLSIDVASSQPGVIDAFQAYPDTAIYSMSQGPPRVRIAGDRADMRFNLDGSVSVPFTITAIDGRARTISPIRMDLFLA